MLDDVVLGPPKTAFDSSRKFRNGGAGDGPTFNEGEELENPRARTFGDRQQNRKSMNAGEKEGRDNRDSWTAIRERRAHGDADDKDDRFGKYNRRERDHDRDADKQDSRWGHRDDRRQNGERSGGWRERENNRHNNKGWNRNEREEKEPEWFDEPVALKKQEEELGVGNVRTQEEFQRWKEMMKGNKQPTEEPPPPAEAPPPPAPAEPAAQTPKPIKFDSLSDSSFGIVSPGPAAEGLPKPAAAKGKSSRFASMFKKEEPAPAPAPVVEETPVQQVANKAAESASDDKAGFQRILQMLGGTNLGQPQMPSQPSEPSSPQPRMTGNGTVKKSRFFDSVPKSPERMQSPQTGFQPQFADRGNGFPPTNRGMSEEPGDMFGLNPRDRQSREMPARSQPSSSLVSPEPLPPSNGNRDSFPPQNRPSDYGIEHPPSRGAATPDVSIQNLLANQRAQRPMASNKDSEFLLGLLNGQRPPSQQTRPDNNFNLWVGQPPETHAPKPRAPPPPGLIDETLLRNAPQDMPRQEPPMHNQGLDMPNRRTSQRVPPPGFDEQHAIFMQQQMREQQQRRQLAEAQHQQPPANRRMSGHPNFPNMPSQQHQQQPQFPPDFPFMQSPPGGHQQGPPPGFPSNMRHPQGLQGMPNIFQQPQREPPGFNGMGPNAMSPPAPPGFGQGPPPGMPPGLMGMRGPNEGIPAGAGGFRPNGRGFDGFGMQERR